MNYKIPDAQLYVDPAGPLPTITFDSNLNATHFHVQVLTPTGWEMVLDSSGPVSYTHLDVYKRQDYLRLP